MSYQRLIFVTIFCLMMAVPAVAIDRTGYNQLVELMDSAKIVEADVFSPKNWEKATRYYGEAAAYLDRGKKQKDIDKKVEKGREFVENCLKATEVTKLSLQEYLQPRVKAQKAGADALVPELYLKAETQFLKATAKVESGNVKSALKEAEKSIPLFDYAEIEAIRADILGAADRLIAKAEADDATKYSLSTLNKATTARKKGDAMITNDRYNLTNAIAEATRAEYEARHASNIAASVRSLNRNDQAWEKLMLLYEIQMNRVGTAIGLEHLPFDDGAIAAADTLIKHIGGMKIEKADMSRSSSDLNKALSDRMLKTLEKLGESTIETDPVILASKLDDRVAELVAANTLLSSEMKASQTELASLSQEHEATSVELEIRQAKEEKFKKAKMKLNPSEGEVLFNSSNDVVLRLSGLSFDIGKSDIKDDHVPLLEKVKEIVSMFPDATLMVEGHTDATGDNAGNVTLSEKRAFAVMQYLRQSLLISASKIQSMGYGADRPVASNQTPGGRAKNRRIDIIIMQ